MSEERDRHLSIEKILAAKTNTFFNNNLDILKSESTRTRFEANNVSNSNVVIKSTHALEENHLDDNAIQILDFFNGSFLEHMTGALSTSAGDVILTVGQSGGGDLTMRFSDGYSTLSDNSTITLTEGTDAAPQANYIYIPRATKVLTKSTTGFPANEHIKVAFIFCPSDTFVSTNSGAYVYQLWNDHLINVNGHMLHISERLRRMGGSSWFSGVDGNGTSGYLTPTAGNVEFKSTAGVAYQLHRQTVVAVDTSTGDLVLVKNWSGTSYNDITNLYDIVNDSTGAAIGNNKYFNLVVWGVVNLSGTYSPVIINLPSGSYNTQSAAQNDVDGHDDFTIPREFNRESSTAFLICRITIQMKTGGGTWTNITTKDLRGQNVASATGGGASPQTDFSDIQFSIFGDSDNTKVILFDADSLITTGNSRTITMPDKDITLIDASDVHTKYTDAEAVNAVEAASNAAIATGDSVLFVDVTDGVLKQDLVSDLIALIALTNLSDVNLTGAQLEDLLIFQSGNEEWIPCNWAGGNATSYKVRNQGMSWISIDGTDGAWTWMCPLPPILNGLKLYVSGIRVTLAAADGDDYVDRIRGFANDSSGATLITGADDTTNRTSSGTYETTFTAVDVSSYEEVGILLSVINTTSGHLDVRHVGMQCYYDT